MRHLQRTETTWEQIVAWCPEATQYPPAVVEQVILEAKYAGYVERQAAQVERFQRLESKQIPSWFDYAAIPQLRAEAREKLARFRPTNVGQASRISGITPADVAVLLLYLD
jgi:tRNA uridine 5-carboxymethylaminomethyl modification enzyme